MQAAGRAGREASQSGRSEMWVQTWHPAHPLYQALTGHDFAAFAASQLAERRAAGLPPWSHLAMLRAEARTQDSARAFLDGAAQRAAALPEAGAVSVYPAVPTSVARVADVERMQMLIESPSRAALQRFLSRWLPALHELRRSTTGEARILRWAVDVDPLAI
jgi:primosomal protein N' (replication factor Y)